MRASWLLVLALPSYLACTASEPDEPKPRKKSSTPASSPASPTPTATPPVADSTPPTIPTPMTATTDWWCVCYQSEGDTGPQPATACRSQESQCRALEKRIARGGKGLITGSLSHGCRTLTGEHPGDAAGGREAWKPSKLAGAWTSEGKCLLEGSPDAEPNGVNEAELFAWLDDESIGPLREGMTASEVVDLLGQPSEKGEIFEEGATGLWVQEWKHPDKGVFLFMRAPTERGAQTVGAITVKAPNEYATKRGIAVGSTRAAVEKAYGDVQDQDRVFDSGGEPDADASTFVAGSIFGGIIFSFEAGKVSEIFMGAAAE